MRLPSPLSSRPCQRTTLLGANSRHDPAGTAAQSLHLKVSAVSPLRTQRVSSGASRSSLGKKLTGKGEFSHRAVSANGKPRTWVG